MSKKRREWGVVWWIFFLSGSLLAQSTRHDLVGVVMDQTGAVIVGAHVLLTDAQGHERATATDGDGEFRFHRLPQGNYRLMVTAPGFEPYVNPHLVLDGHLNQPLEITLTVVITEEVEIQEPAGVSLAPGDNLSAIVLRGADLESLPDDPEELLEVLRQMAGPSSGMGDAQVYVDGFEHEGELPPKEAIREIRINSNPFSAEYSQPGFGRIEILTRPGMASFRGNGYFGFNDEALNAREPFAPRRAPRQIRRFGGSLGGPIVRKRMGFFTHLDRRAIDENAVVQATILDPISLQPTSLATTVLTPQVLTRWGLRTDTQVTSNNTLMAQYALSDNRSENQGIGEFRLPEHGFSSHSRQHELRFSLSSILNKRLVNEVRLRLSRRETQTVAASAAPQIIVLDAFTGGGAQSSLFTRARRDRMEWADHLSVALGRHAVKLGLRIDGVHLEDVNRSNFGGTFIFSSLDQYRDVLSGVEGAHPEQFTLNRGDPFTALTQWEFSWFVQEDWRVRSNLTVSFGLRHEFQTHLPDKMNVAPRLGFAWAPGGSRRTAIRGGFGLFFDRLQENLVLSVRRSRRQEQLIILDPGFPDPFVGNGEIRQRPRSVRILSPELNAPYVMQATISLERQLPSGIVSSVTYSWVRGVHQFRSRNVNAPFPGTMQRPFPDRGPILALESVARSVRHELRVNFRRRLGGRFTVFGNYVLSSTRSDGDGPFSLPADSYDLRAEWGRAAIDARHRFFLGGFVRLPWSLRLAPFIILRSGQPFNITTGRDNNHDTAFTDRPALVDPSTPGAIITPLGAFDPQPTPESPVIPRNFGQGPGFANVNLYVTKTFGFGSRKSPRWPSATGARERDAAQRAPHADRRSRSATANRSSGANRPSRPRPRPGIGGRGRFGRGAGRGGRWGRWGGFNEYHYNLTIGIRIRNLFNRLNLGQPSGVLTSPFFGQANSARSPRRIEVQLRFNF